MHLRKGSSCIDVVILASKMQNQNNGGVHVGTHMHLYKEKKKKKY